VLNGSLQLKAVKKLVIDEVDIMLEAGFRLGIKLPTCESEQAEISAYLRFCFL
jgi:hypothetical protein